MNYKAFNTPLPGLVFDEGYGLGIYNRNTLIYLHQANFKIPIEKQTKQQAEIIATTILNLVNNSR